MRKPPIAISSGSWPGPVNGRPSRPAWASVDGTGTLTAPEVVPSDVAVGLKGSAPGVWIPGAAGVRPVTVPAAGTVSPVTGPVVVPEGAVVVSLPVAGTGVVGLGV